MEFRILSAAEAGPWREQDVPPSERGVSRHWLARFVADRWASVNEPRRLAIEQGERARGHNKAGRWGRHDMPDMEIPEVPPYYFLNTHGLKSEFILPLTQDIRAPLFALVPPEHRGRPTAFISHTWNSLLIGPQQQRIGTLDAVYEDKDEFVWIDFACYNQHTVENRNISADMHGIIKVINKVVVAVTPTPLYNRSWCLWELYCADTIGLTPVFRTCRGFRNDKIQAVNALYRSFTGVENARSITVQAEEEIRDAIVSRYGGVEKTNAAIKDMLKRQLGSSWHELQPDDGPLKFSPGPWAADPDGSTLRAYLPYWERGLMDSFIHGGKETVREVFAGAGVYIGAQETATLSVQKSDPANRRLIDALQNEDVESIMSVVYAVRLDVNQPLPFRGILSFEVAPPLHFLIPWAKQRTIEALTLRGADVNLPWTYPPETRSDDAAQRQGLVSELLNGVGDPRLASWTPLMLAVNRGDAGICTMLIQHAAQAGFGAQAGFRCPQTGLTALHLAAAIKRKDLVELLAPGASIDAQLANGITALHIAAMLGDVDSIALLLKCGANKDLRDRTGQSALELAVARGHSEVMSLLDPEERQSSLQSVQDQRECFIGIQNNDVLTIERALSRGVDFTKSPLGPATLFGHAVWKGNLEIVRLLLASGLDCNADTGTGTALVLAIEKGHSDVAEALLEAGADVNAEDKDGGTALSWTAQMSNTALATRLLDLHADVAHAKHSNGATALTLAADKGNVALVDVLLSRGAPVDAITSSGNTALHFAAYRGHERIVELLLRHRAARTLRNRDNLTPSDLALSEGHKRVAELLL